MPIWCFTLTLTFYFDTLIFTITLDLWPSTNIWVNTKLTRHFCLRKTIEKRELRLNGEAIKKYQGIKFVTNAILQGESVPRFDILLTVYLLSWKNYLYGSYGEKTFGLVARTKNMLPFFEKIVKNYGTECPN